MQWGFAFPLSVSCPLSRHPHLPYPCTGAAGVGTTQAFLEPEPELAPPEIRDIKKGRNEDADKVSKRLTWFLLPARQVTCAHMLITSVWCVRE